MRLADCIMRPGRVMRADDDGTIRASAPGLFSDVDNPDNMPPIYPMLGVCTGCFSKPSEGDEVWIINNLSNPYQLMWFRKQKCEDIDEKMMSEKGLNVICYKNDDSGWASIYFADGKGWIINNNDNIINIDKDGNIIMTGNGSSISLRSNGVNLGSDGQSSHPVAFGDDVAQSFNDIISIMEGMSKIMGSNQITAPLAVPIETQLPILKNRVSQMLSKKVFTE